MKTVSKEQNSIPAECAKIFKELHNGETIMLKDDRSSAGARVQIKASVSVIYYMSPEKDIIPEQIGQKKADYVIYCDCRIRQISFIELKGQNISNSSNRSPFAQILSTIEYFSKDEYLKQLLSQNIEKHAFIVSSEKQRIPSGMSIAERQLLYKLGTSCKKNFNVSSFLHYVKFFPKGKYSDNAGRIICSSDDPLEFPYIKR